MMAALAPEARDISVKQFLARFSTEVTTADQASIANAGALLAPGTEVFIASLPKDKPEALAVVAGKLRRAGLTPVPHLVARNYRDLAHFGETLRQLSDEAGVDRALVLAGDKPTPVGTLTSSLDLLRSGFLQRHGVRSISIACYPEGHPHIPTDVLDAVRAEKLSIARETGLLVTLVSQFCFDAAPIIALAERMRAQGVCAPFRVGLAAPASRATLIKYALICGVGASLRALQARQGMAANLLASEAPDAILAELAAAQSRQPSLRLAGAHFFTFASLASLTKWMQTL